MESFSLFCYSYTWKRGPEGEAPPLLELIQKTLGVGIVRKNNENTVLFRVSDIKELQIIMKHFKNYPLVSAKYSDFLLFEQCLELIKEKAHGLLSFAVPRKRIIKNSISKSSGFALK